jgi:hypothetical protein
MLIRGTLPRLKPDQLMGFSWKFLLPLSLINILALSLARFYLIEHHWGYLVATVFAVVFGLGGFCVFSSRMLEKQIEARFAS